jgi:integrase
VLGSALRVLDDTSGSWPLRAGTARGKHGQERVFGLCAAMSCADLPRRYGCATFLLAQGVPARAIMEVLGHAEIGVTMNTYTHVLPELRQEAADAIDELFGI